MTSKSSRKYVSHRRPMMKMIMALSLADDKGKNCHHRMQKIGAVDFEVICMVDFEVNSYYFEVNSGT